MTMKKYLLLFTILISTSFVLLAQEEDPDPRTGKLQEKMEMYIQKKLNLSKVESEKFSPVFLQYISELRKTHQENRADRPMLQLKIAELRVRFRDEFRKIIDEKRANRVFLHQKEFEDKVRQEILERRMQNRKGLDNRVRNKQR